MRNVPLNTPDAAPQNPARLARLTRHLNARLLDFGPGGPEVVELDEVRGFVSTRFPGQETAQVVSALEGMGVHPTTEHALVVFYLQSDSRFEDLDYVWGCLFDIL